MTSMRDAQNASYRISDCNWYPSAAWAAKKIAALIGTEYMGGNLVRTDEAIVAVKVNRAHSLCWVEEAEAN